MRSINRNSEHTEIINRIRSRDADSKEQVIPLIKTILCYAALIGFENESRKPLSNDKENIEWHTFDSDGHTDYIYLIALAETTDVNVLRYDHENSSQEGEGEDMVKIFEEYANGGLYIIRSWFDKKADDAYGTEAIIQGIQEAGLLDIKTEEVFDEVEF